MELIERKNKNNRQSMTIYEKIFVSLQSEKQKNA